MFSNRRDRRALPGGCGRRRRHSRRGAASAGQPGLDPPGRAGCARTCDSHIVFALGALLATPLAAQVIDFETDPAGATSVDDTPLGLASAYAVGPLSITFGFDADLNGVPETPASIELVGPDVIDGFAACLARDTAAPGFGTQLGSFFLRGNAATDFGLLVINYAGGAVNGASGEIWDIDGLSNGTEQYRVRAYDAGGMLLATIDSPLSTQDSGCANTELDGRPWLFSFTGVPGIARIAIDFIGTKTNGIGLASTTSTPPGMGPSRSCR